MALSIQFWPPTPLEWRIMDILHNTHDHWPMTICKLSSEHLPTLSCPRSYWMTSSCYGYFRICVFTLNVWWEIRTAETNFCFTLKTQWADFINLIRKIASLSIQNEKKIRLFFNHKSWWERCTSFEIFLTHLVISSC